MKTTNIHGKFYKPYTKKNLYIRINVIKKTRHEERCELHVSKLAILVLAVEFKICFRKIVTRERYIR
jgi:hypothetical protein